MMSVIMLSVFMLNVAMLSVVMLSVAMLSVVMMSVIMLSVVMKSVAMLSVVMLGVAILSVMAPRKGTCLYREQLYLQSQSFKIVKVHFLFQYFLQFRQTFLF
jgi:hypothetical protein